MNKVSLDLPTWLPAFGISILVISWYYGGNPQFLGDFFVPSNPIHYLTRFSQSWDPNLDFGLFTLFGLLPTSRVMLLLFYSGIFALSGSPVAVEFLLVLTVLLSAYFGMRYLWLSINGTQRNPWAAAVAGLYFVLNPYVMLYITNPVGIIAYATIPWCLAFALRGLKTDKPVKYSVFLGIGFSISLVTFPQVAISLVIAAIIGAIIFYDFLARRNAHLSQVKFLGLSTVTIIGLNAYWFFLAISRVDVIFGLSSAVQSESASLNAQNSILATFRILGDWSFLGGYAGRPYVPYSANYLSGFATIASTFMIPGLAFGSVLLRSDRKRKVLAAAFSILGITLASGTNAPLGSVYSEIIALPGLSLFRNPPRYFLPVAVVGYAILLGCFVGFLVLRVRTRVRVTRLVSIGTVVLIILAITLASEPMLSGEITRNWYAPEMKGYHIPSYYSELDNWLYSNDRGGRVFVLPNTGVYMATLWGYQGGNIYPYLISNPIITGSGGQYSPSSASTLINAVYSEFYANRTTQLGKVMSVLGTAYVLFDQSVDTKFYGLPDPEITWALLSHQSDLRLVGVFGNLTLFRNMENLNPVAATYGINILNGTARDPASIVSIDDFTKGWQFTQDPTQNDNESMMLTPNGLSVDLIAGGHYVFAELYKNVSVAPGPKYLILSAHTASPTSVALTVNEGDVEVPLYATDPPANSLLNHYNLANQTYLVYRIDNLTSNITRIRLAISNRLAVSYSGKLTAEFSNLDLANRVGDLSDLVDYVGQSGFDQAVRAVTLPQFLDSSKGMPLFAMNQSETPPPLVVESIDTEGAKISVNAAHPFVLTFFEAFDRDFAAEVNGVLQFSHFPIDGFANGWFINSTGTLSIRVYFISQQTLLIGATTSLGTIVVMGYLSLFGISGFSKLGEFVLRQRKRIR